MKLSFIMHDHEMAYETRVNKSDYANLSHICKIQGYPQWHLIDVPVT